MTGLANKTALVTGASRGIGRATAQALSSCHRLALVLHPAILASRACRRSLRMQPRKERWKRWCGTGQRYSARAASALILSLRV
jgi:NAD(P)-dependent dehydrogenase (short-subunit alcohol dehydrogenase family)